jgi:hypothetical protein
MTTTKKQQEEPSTEYPQTWLFEEHGETIAGTFLRFEQGMTKRYGPKAAKASMLSDVYGHVVVDPDEDEWGAFWQQAYQAQTRPKRALKLSPGGAPVGPGKGL